MVTKGENGRERTDWEFGVSRCKLLYIGWTNNKVLLFNTGNYIKYFVINHNGKEYDKVSVQFSCFSSVQFSSVQSLSRVQLFVNP